MSINYKKLKNSKWTALKPKDREKHFVVIKVITHCDDDQKVREVLLEAILSKKVHRLKPSELADKTYWLEGWR